MPAASGRQPAAPARSPPPLACSASPPALELEHRARRPSALGHLGHGMRSGAGARAPGRRRALEHQGANLWVIWVMAAWWPKWPKGMGGAVMGAWGR